MDVVLVPGLWLDASTWSEVAMRLSAAGHRPHPLTLRGFSSRTADRQGMMLADHVAEIVDTVDRSDGPVVIVGHAEACGLVHAAVNRRPELIRRAIHVGGLPSADGTRVLSGFAVDPEGTPTGTAGHRVLDPALAALYRRVKENAAQAFDAVQHLTDNRRFDVPTTVVATEYRTEDVRRWMQAGIDPARELTRLTDLTLVDLPSGRWPQMERADELARLIVDQTGLTLTVPTIPTAIIHPVAADS